MAPSPTSATVPSGEASSTHRHRIVAHLQHGRRVHRHRPRSNHLVAVAQHTPRTHTRPRPTVDQRDERRHVSRARNGHVRMTSTSTGRDGEKEVDAQLSADGNERTWDDPRPRSSADLKIRPAARAANRPRQSVAAEDDFCLAAEFEPRRQILFVSLGLGDSQSVFMPVTTTHPIRLLETYRVSRL